MAVFLLLGTLSLADPADPAVHLTAHDHVLDGTAATVGGITGAAVVGYLTFAASSITDIAGENFSKEAGLGLGYAVGMPLGMALGLDLAARIRGRGPAFKAAFKNAEIGVLIGLTAVMIGGIVSNDTRYWAAMVALPFPIVSGISGYHRSLRLQQNTIQNGDALLRDRKLYCRLWALALK
jgi:hypothetical protein